MNVIKFLKEMLPEVEVTIKLAWLLKIGVLAVGFIGLCLAFFIYSERPSVKNSFKNKFDTFYYSDIKGRIKLYKDGRPIYFQIEGSDNTYEFFIGQALKVKYPSSSIIEIGDSIIKPNRSDVIKIKKATGETLYFSINEKWRKIWTNYIID